MACPSSNSTCPRAFFTMTRSIRSSSGVHMATGSFPGEASIRWAASIRLRKRGLRARIREAVGNCRGSGSIYPEITGARNAAEYSSSLPNPELHS